MSDSKELVERLRGVTLFQSFDYNCALNAEAADRIEALEAENAQLKADMDVALAACGAENARLREALIGIAQNADTATDLRLFTIQCRDFARTALEVKP